ncbi:Polyphosphate kinase [Anoxybacillus sp. BCO1]|nr:Polyphosphate kinase [Anoxybacillus sp. BCO1]
MAVDAYRPFPMLLNKSLNLAIVLDDEEDEDERKKLAIVQVPAVLNRFIPLPANNDMHAYALLEDVITTFIHTLFKGYTVSSVTQFRITRNADLTIHEEGARDLLKEIEKELKKKKMGRSCPA